MASSGFPADRLDVLQRLPTASLWSRDPQYRSYVASVAGYTRLLNAERDERGRFIKRKVPPAQPDEWAMLVL